MALAVMGLVLASIPMIAATARPGPEARAAAQEIASALRLARGEAILRYKPAVLFLDVEQRLYRVADGKERALDESLGFKFVTARSELAGAAAGHIRFFPDGSSTGGRITVTGSGRSYVVTVDWLTGAVEVEG